MRTITLMIISLIVGLVIGGIISDSLSKPEYIEVPVTKEVEVERIVIKTVYQEVPLIKEVEVVKEIPVEVIKEVPIEARYFETVAEFEKWVDENHALLAISFVEFNKHDPQNDCEDQADRWQLKALEEYGYLVSACPVYNGYVFDTYVGGGKYHVGLWTSIGNNYYYWESVTGKITKLGVVRD